MTNNIINAADSAATEIINSVKDPTELIQALRKYTFSENDNTLLHDYVSGMLLMFYNRGRYEEIKKPEDRK